MKNTFYMHVCSKTGTKTSLEKFSQLSGKYLEESLNIGFRRKEEGK